MMGDAMTKETTVAMTMLKMTLRSSLRRHSQVGNEAAGSRRAGKTEVKDHVVEQAATLPPMVAKRRAGFMRMYGK